MSTITDYDNDRIGQIVVDEAFELFEDLGFVDDFCVQSVGMSDVVFGGTNRVIWSVRTGFRMDRSYCTSKFIAAWHRRNSNE